MLRNFLHNDRPWKIRGRRVSYQFPSFTLLWPPFQRDAFAKTRKYRVLLRISISWLYGISFRESSRVRWDGTLTRIRFSLFNQIKEKKKIKIIAKCLVALAYTRTHTYTCTRVPSGERVRLAVATCSLPLLKADFSTIKSRRNTRLLSERAARLENAIRGNLFGKSQLPRAPFATPFPRMHACTWMVNIWYFTYTNFLIGRSLSFLATRA